MKFFSQNQDQNLQRVMQISALAKVKFFLVCNIFNELISFPGFMGAFWVLSGCFMGALWVLSGCFLDVF